MSLLDSLFDFDAKAAAAERRRILEELHGKIQISNKR